MEHHYIKVTFGFNTLAYANKLITAGIPSEIAEAHATANAELIENLVEGTLATKQDLSLFESKLKQEIKELENRLTLRVGTIVMGSLGAFLTIISLLHAFR